jgi:hypothetical protein
MVAGVGISETKNGVALGFEVSGQGFSSTYLIRKSMQKFLKQ